MDQLIPVVNKLQDVFGAIGYQGIDLPQIVVIGSQSAGKSSVLENIVGRDFLPRGSGICTRRPLVLQLYSIEKDAHSSGEGEEWGEFLHLPGQKFFDFTEIRAEIQRETDRVTGRNKGVSNKSMNLKIFSPYVLNLTLVDLPGITKVPTGDQPENIEELIRGCCYEFAKNPNAIILAVSAANQDLVNSEGLKLARELDPEGERTIGVITKVDIMDQGTDCTDILTNKVVPLKKGYIAMINRSQKDIQDNVSIRQGLAKEQAFFRNHAHYAHLMAKCGTANLSAALNQMLMIHIRDCLPEIKSKINHLLQSVHRDLDALGEGPDESEGKNTLGATLLTILSQFSRNFQQIVEGKGIHGAISSSEMTELYGGARVAYIFNEVFGKRVRTLDPFEGLEDEDIRTAIANATGTRSALFVPEMSFDLLVRKQISRLEQPGLQCVDLVLDEMQRMVSQSETQELSRFPELRDRTMEIVGKLLRNCLQPAQKMISNMVLVEKSYINTSHPDFIGGKAAVNAAQQSIKQQQQYQLQMQHHNSSGHYNATGGNGTGARGDAAAQPSQGSLPPPPGASSESAGGSQIPPALRTPGSNDSTTGAVTNTNEGFAGGFVKFFQSPNANTNKHASGRMAAGAGSSGQSHRGTGEDSAVDEFNGIRLAKVPDKMRCSSQPSDKERVETEIIKNLISSYFDIVKKNFMDLVPKTIMHFLVNNFKENLQNELVSQLYKEHFLANLMREADDVAEKRKAFREMRDLLYRAIEIVNEVRDFHPVTHTK